MTVENYRYRYRLADCCLELHLARHGAANPVAARREQMRIALLFARARDEAWRRS